jgi:hypothetical protein
MADAMVDAMVDAKVDAKKCTLKRSDLSLGQEYFIKGKDVLDWNIKEGYKFLYYESEDHMYVIKVKSLRPYDTFRITCAEMIDLLKKEVEEDKKDQLLTVKTNMSYSKTLEPVTFEKTMIGLINDIDRDLELPFARVKIYLHSDSGKITYFEEVGDKTKTVAPPKTKTADSPFRPRRKLSKRLKKSSSKSAQKRRKSKKRSAKPRRR